MVFLHTLVVLSNWIVTYDFNDDNITLEDLYLEYQTKASAIILGGEPNLINNY